MGRLSNFIYHFQTLQYGSISMTLANNSYRSNIALKLFRNSMVDGALVTHILFASNRYRICFEMTTNWVSTVVSLTTSILEYLFSFKGSIHWSRFKFSQKQKKNPIAQNCKRHHHSFYFVPHARGTKINHICSDFEIFCKKKMPKCQMTATKTTTTTTSNNTDSIHNINKTNQLYALLRRCFVYAYHSKTLSLRRFFLYTL